MVEDEIQLQAARDSFENGADMAANPISFDAVLTAYPGKPLSLQVTDGESTVSAAGEAVQSAQNKALDETEEAAPSGEYTEPVDPEETDVIFESGAEDLPDSE